MSLQQMAVHALRSAVDRVRRDAIACSICAVCGLAALVLATWAAVLSLVPLVGAVYALLIVAGGFVLASVGTMLWLNQANAPPKAVSKPLPVGATADATQRSAQFAQIAMIIEAAMLGFSLSRRFDRR